MLMLRIPGMIRIKRLVQRRPSHQSSHVFQPDADPAERELVLSVMQEGIYILTRGASDCNITSGRSFIQSSYGQIWLLIV